MTTISITPLYAALLTIFYLILSFLVIRGRWKYVIPLGHGPHKEMQKLVRIHGNFIEYTPLALLLLLMSELNHAPSEFLHISGALFFIARVFHAQGIKKTRNTSLGRFLGTSLTYLVLFSQSCYLLFAVLS